MHKTVVNHKYTFKTYIHTHIITEHIKRGEKKEGIQRESTYTTHTHTHTHTHTQRRQLIERKHNVVEPVYKELGHHPWSQLHRDMYNSTPEMKTPPLIRTLYKLSLGERQL